MAIQLPMVTGFYEDSSKPIASQECINLIPVIPTTQALSKAQLKGTPGIETFTTVANNQVARGEWKMKGIVYTVNGTILYRINSDKTSTALGTIEGSGRVSIADNGVQMCIVVPELKAYIYTVVAGLAEITDANYLATFAPSSQVVNKNGYFIHYGKTVAATPNNSPAIFLSDLGDGATFTDALAFGTAEVDPDAITSINVSRDILFVGGEDTIEPFQFVGGGVPFPFQRISGAVIETGIKAKFSVVKYKQSFVFIGKGKNEKPSIWQFAGNSVQKIATPAIDKIIEESTDTEVEEIFCSTYAQNGEFFLNIHFKNRLLTFDSTTNLWHERKSKDTNGQLVKWRVEGIIEGYGEILVTDNQGGLIGKINDSIFTEYGVNRIHRFSTMPYSTDGERISVSQMEITCESGVGLATGDGSDPQITREFSDDGGFTFSNGTSRGLGKQGEYKRRQIWRKEGQIPRFRVYRFTVSDPVKVVIIKLEAEFTVNANN